MLERTGKLVGGFAKTATFIFTFSLIFTGLSHLIGRFWSFLKGSAKSVDQRAKEINEYYKIHGRLCLSCGMYVPKGNTCINCNTQTKSSTVKQLPMQGS